MNKLVFILISLLAIVYVVLQVRSNKFSIIESFWWIIASIIMLFLSIWPYSINFLADLLNIEYPPSLFFVFCIIFLLFVCFKNSKNIAKQHEMIIELEQELSIVREKSKDSK